MLLFSRFPFKSVWSLMAIAGSIAILIGMSTYFDSVRTATFLLEKGPLRNQPIWRTAFYFHVVSASVCLATGPMLMIMRLIRLRRFHAAVGYVYLNTVLWIAAPTGLIISPESKGGSIAAAGFLVTGLLWWYTTWMGYRTIRAKRRGAHVTWMIRSYSIALSAVWFRAIQLLLAAGIPSIDNTTIYIASVWLSLLASLLISETSILSIFGKPQASMTLLRHVSASSPAGQLP